jgi:hypothetical protein
MSTNAIPIANHAARNRANAAHSTGPKPEAAGARLSPTASSPNAANYKKTSLKPKLASFFQIPPLRQRALRRRRQTGGYIAGGVDDASD